jgi:hypothetical protein
VRSWMGRMGWKGSQAEATRMENTCRKEDEEMGGRVCISVGRGGGGGGHRSSKMGCQLALQQQEHARQCVPHCQSWSWRRA